MKLWKKAAAAVLAAVMSLTLLTGCSGGGGGGTGIVRDSAKEKLVTQWTQEYVAELAKGYGVDGFALTVDETAEKASAAALPFLIQQAEFRVKNPNMGDWTEEQKKEYSQLLSNELNYGIKELKDNAKKGIPLGIYCPISNFSEPTIKAVLDASKSSVMNLLKLEGVEIQDVKTLGVVVTVKENVVFMEITFAT